MNRSTQFLLSLALAVALGLFVWTYVDLPRLLDTLATLAWPWFLVGLGAFFAYQLIRSLRFRILVRRDASVYAMFNTQCLHSFFNELLPLGFGEIAFIYLLKKLNGVEYPLGAAALLLVRVVDLAIFILCFLVVAGLFFERTPQFFFYIALGGAGLIVVGYRTLLAVGRNGAGVEGDGWMARGRRFLGRVQDVTETMRERGALGRVILLSSGMWLSMFLYFASTIYALGFDIPPGDILGFYLLLFPMRLLPIKGIGNIGTHETSWFIALGVVGVSSADASILGFGSHLLMYLTVAIATLVALGGLWLFPVAGQDALSREGGR